MIEIVMPGHLKKQIQQIEQETDIPGLLNLLRFFCGLGYSPGRIVQEFQDAGVSRQRYSELRAQIPIREIVPVQD